MPVTADDVKVNEEGDDMIFLNLLDAYTKQERNVSPHRSSSFAPAVFAKDPACKRDKPAMESAMNRLFAAGRVKVDTFGPKSRERSRLVRT